MLTSSCEATAIYKRSQNIDRYIQSKIEHRDNTGFYRKPTTKNLFVHFKSALSVNAKTNYIRNEIKRIHNRCSEEKDKITHTARHTLYKHPQKQWLSNINHTTYKQ